MAQTVGYSLFLIVVPIKWFIAANIGTMWIPFAGAVLYCIVVWPAAFIGYRQTLSRASKDQLGQLAEAK